MSDLCEAHLERAGIEVPEYRLGLCLACYMGKDINFTPSGDCPRCGAMRHRGACRRQDVEEKITLDNAV